MDQLNVGQLAQQLGISLEEVTSSALERALRRELLELQADNATPEMEDRRRILTMALGDLRTAHTTTSTELITMPSAVLADLVRTIASSGHASEPDPERRMRTGVQAAATQARKDFRNARTLPLVGFSGVAAFAWAQRESLGLNIDPKGYAGTIVACVLLMVLAFYLMAWAAQRRDEKNLRHLYLPEAQTWALRSITSIEFQDVRHFNPRFELPQFKRELASAAFHPTSVLWRPRYRNAAFAYGPFRRLLSMSHFLSTVDLEAALDDAAELALERFEKLGVIEPTGSWSGLEYRVTTKFTPKPTEGA